MSLNNGLELAFPPHIAQGLEKAAPADLADIEISPSGFGVHFPRLDAHLYLPALLQGVFGSKRWMAAQLGAAQRRQDGRGPHQRPTRRPTAQGCREMKTAIVGSREELDPTYAGGT